ncbi:MAG: dihydropteroate synthase-like protein [Methanobrevibacter sp.]|jgi:dihydropteroate synthase-like protein|nr:dihydropteroate synthase-like protein [Candidatus Methanoflexus mossambicus]
MNIIIVTGELAYPLIEKIAEKSKENVWVHIAKTQIAAFLTPNKVIKEINTLKKENPELIAGTDMILVPGLMKKDTSEITKTLNIPCFKGPKDGSDIEVVLDLIDKIELSETKPADKLIEEEKLKKAIEFIDNFEKDSEKINELLKKPNNIKIKDLPVGEDFPMRVLAEIANAPLLSKEELLSKCQYFIDNGADMIDIGMVAGEDYSHKIPELINDLREIIGNRPLSIDTLNENEIKIAIENDIDLVLSLDLGNYKNLLTILKEKDIPVVLLPTDFKNNIIPKTIDERIIAIEKLINRIKYTYTPSVGEKNSDNNNNSNNKELRFFADLILDPVNSKSIVDSIISFKKFKERNPYPTFFGVGNVSELLDADSPGVNALISGIAMELGASVLFTPDESGKSWNSVYELSIASKMMFLAKNRGSIAKDLGINLIQFKDQKKLQFSNKSTINEDNELSNIDYKDINEETENIPIYSAEEDPKFKMDPKGSFKINVIHGTRYDKSKIVVTHYKKGKATAKIEGIEAKKIYNEILKKELITRYEHVAYLGSELQKAEIAMITSKEYIQDFELFKKPLILD